MEYLSSIILGVVQGLTEFLPISSSGHLILAREVLHLNTDLGLSFDAVLQLATSIAVLVYFRRDFLALLVSFFRLLGGRAVEQNQKILFLALVLGTIPAVIAGLFLERQMETVFRSATLVAAMLLLGSLLFYIAEKVAKQNSPLSARKGIIIGLFQCLALIPGFSRSGVTISGGLLLGLTREEAAKFGFLLSFPIIFGSGFFKLVELIRGGSLGTIGAPLLLGSLVSFVVGIGVIHFLLRYLRTHTLSIFIYYRVALALLVLALMYL
jgi:undecaprenyl-diphosphatase